MYAVMIVDDEAIIRQGLRHVVDWEQLGFKITMEAKNGRDALARLAENSVDLIITDIKMPKMDGIELLREIRNQYSNLCVIFLSGFDEFSFARQGIVLGAFDYILKPMEPGKIMEVLQRAYNFLEREKQHQEEQNRLLTKLDLHIAISREKILANLLCGKDLPILKLEDLCREYRINLRNAPVQVAIVEIDDFDINGEEWLTNGLDELLVRELKLELENLLGGNSEITVLITEGDFGSLDVMIQPENESASIDICALSAELFDKFLKEINRSKSIRITIGIGNVYSRIDQIHLSYIDAKDALRHKYVLGGNTIIHSNQFRLPPRQGFIYPVERERLLLSYIILGDDRSLEVAADLFAEVVEGENNDLYKASVTLTQTVRNIIRDIQEQFPFLGKIYDTQKWTKFQFTNDKNIDNIREHFTNIIKELLGTIKEYKLNQRSSIINKACEYVMNHLEKEIALRSISEYLGISKNYFCSLFKQETGENFLDYVTRLKMERAKILIREGNYKAYEVCEMLGYSETAYFGRLFKKHTGYNLSEYRKYASD